jgi:hypothetical protein
MKSKKKKVFGFVLGQVVFCLVFLFYFTHFSFLRPLTNAVLELIIAVILIIAMLANSWFIYPNFHGKIPTFTMFAIFFRGRSASNLNGIRIDIQFKPFCSL